MPRNGKHPDEMDLAAFSGGELGFFERYRLERHLRGCEECQSAVADFRDLRAGLKELDAPAVMREATWESLAAEMRANIHLGIEAGECVREAGTPRLVSPRLALVFASLMLLAGAGVFLRDYRPERAAVVASGPPVTATPDYRIPVLETSMQGIEIRTGENSFAFLNREGGAVNQTVSAEGAVRSRDIDGDAGTVTIRDVYLQ